MLKGTRAVGLPRAGQGVALGSAPPDWYRIILLRKQMRDRLARLLAAIERRTGAVVVGLAGDRSQLLGWRFDRELAARLPLAA